MPSWLFPLVSLPITETRNFGMLCTSSITNSKSGIHIRTSELGQDLKTLLFYARKFVPINPARLTPCTKVLARLVIDSSTGFKPRTNLTGSLHYLRRSRRLFSKIDNKNQQVLNPRTRSLFIYTTSCNHKVASTGYTTHATYPGFGSRRRSKAVPYVNRTD